MAITFKEVRELQGQRVRMQFDDGREVVALLLCATKDIDGSRHLIYDKVESVAGAEASDTAAMGCFYADAKSLVGIDAAGANKVARPLRGWETFGVRQEVEKAPPKNWHPSA